MLCSHNQKSQICSFFFTWLPSTLFLIPKRHRRASSLWHGKEEHSSQILLPPLVKRQKSEPPTLCMSQIISGWVILRRSLLPFKGLEWSLNSCPRKSSSDRACCWIMVPMPPSKTMIRSCRTDSISSPTLFWGSAARKQIQYSSIFEIPIYTLVPLELFPFKKQNKITNPLLKSNSNWFTSPTAPITWCQVTAASI